MINKGVTMQLNNYSEEYIKEQMGDFDEFRSVVYDMHGVNRYSPEMLAILYTVMKLEKPRENSGYSGY